MRQSKYYFLLVILAFSSCTLQSSEKEKFLIKTGAAQTEKYISLLKEKKIAVVANHTSRIDTTHLVDSLLSLGIDIQKIFSPEHGFRGKADAGEHVKNYTDKKTGLPVISLYGSSKKPELEDLNGLDMIVFDLQDVGVRYYTYISTMHYVMEACAEKNVELLILDRPNPNGFYVDGPVLDISFSSFFKKCIFPVVYIIIVKETSGLFYIFVFYRKFFNMLFD
jgi:uncharacterized protein YbbC (DUF1343 family)